MNRAPRLLSLAAIAALAVAACGGTAATGTPTPAATPTDAPVTTAPTAAPTVETPTEAPATASPAGEGPDLEGATAALENIKKYEMSMTVAGIAGIATDSEISMTNLVDTDAEAYQLEMAGFAGMPGAEEGITVIVIGSDAWVDAGTGTYIKQPGGASTYDQMRTALAPATLLAQIPTAGLGILGGTDEEKNGVATKHYHAEAATVPGLSASIGDDGVMDIWVAEDGGFLVSMTMTGTMAGNPMSMSIDMRRINDESIEIVAPE
jgi:hypothetical protein